MDSKFSVFPTIWDHYRTLVDESNEDDPQAPFWPDYAVIIGVPLVAGTVVGLTARLQDMQSYIGGVAIFTALLFGMVIYVFQLRMQLLGHPKVPRDGDLAGFVDQLFANVNYAVVVGVIATALSMAAAVTADDNGRVNEVWSGVVVAIGVHLLLVVFMCIKRIRAAYHEIRKLPQHRSSDA